MDHLYRIYAFSIDNIMYLLPVGTFILYSIFQERVVGRVVRRVFNYIIGTLVIIICLMFFFSNTIRSGGVEVAIYEKDGKFVLQKEPGIYFGLYQAYYFKNKPVIHCTGDEKEPSFLNKKLRKQACDYHVVNWVEFVKIVNSLNSFDVSNERGITNTGTLIENTLKYHKIAPLPYLTITTKEELR